MFHKLFEEQDEIPDYRMYMADGFRESHGYTENGEIETIRNAEHTGILLLFEFPQSVDLEINEEKKSGLLPNWLITDNIAIGINFQTSKGIIIRDTQQLQLLKHEFIREKVLARKMLFRSDLDSYVKDVNTMMSDGYVTHNYYIEYSPCLLHLIPANILEQQIILDTVRFVLWSCW